MTVSSWTTASGVWTSAANWSAGVPGPGDTAVFDDVATAAAVAPGAFGYVDGTAETVTGAGVAGTVIVADPASLFGTITDSVGIIRGVATTSAGLAKANQSPRVVLAGPGAFWSSGTGMVLAANTALDVQDGAVLSVGTAGVTLQDGATLNLAGAQMGSTELPGALSGPVVLAGGLLVGSGNETVAGAILVSGFGTLAASNFYTDRFVLSGPVSGGALTVGDIEPAPAGDAFENAYEKSSGTLVLAGSDTLASGISVLVGETLELAARDAAGGAAITLQAGAGLAVDAGAVVSGAITVTGLPPGFFRSQATTITNTDASLLVLESSSGTVVTGPNSVLVNEVRLTFLNGAGRSTVIGGSGDDAGGGLILGGTGSVTVFGGRNEVVGGTAGHNLMVSTVGDPTLAQTYGGTIGQSLFGGGTGDLLVGDSGGDLLVAGAGNETLTGAGETRASYGLGTGTMIFGAAGADLLVAGGLADTVVAGSGPTTMFGGSGPGLLDAGSGADLVVTGTGNAYVQAGTGAATVQAALGANTLVFLNGHGGGTELVEGFKVGQDMLSLRGFGGGPQSGVASSQALGGSTVLTLADSTRITLDGVASLGGASFG
ncbi:MAG: beta strand repeat-containing protein [Janthinobacterium lividum]